MFAANYRRAVQSAFLIVVTASAVGCATRGTTHQGRSEVASPPARDVISSEELAAVPAATAYEAILLVRPLFLSRRGSMHAPVIIVDNMMRVSLDELQRIPLTSVREIRFMDAGRATVSYGSGFTGGVIVLLTRSGPR